MRPHARHGALDDGPRDAVPHQLGRNITDSQTATFDFGNLQVVWTHRSYGDTPDPKYPWAATFYGDKGTLKAGVMGYDYTPSAKGAQPVPADLWRDLRRSLPDYMIPQVFVSVADFPRLIIEHNMRVIMGLAHHIYCLAHGKLLAAGTPDEIRNDQRVIDAYLGAR